MVYIGKLYVEYLPKKPILIFIQAGGPCKWTNDSQCFRLENFDIIHDCPLHIYCYSLQFLPSVRADLKPDHLVTKRCPLLPWNSGVAAGVLVGPD